MIGLFFFASFSSFVVSALRCYYNDRIQVMIILNYYMGFHGAHSTAKAKQSIYQDEMIS